MTQEKFNLVKQLLTSGNSYSDMRYFSLSIESFEWNKGRYYSITCFPTDILCDFFGEFIAYFVHVQEVANCSLSVRVLNGVAVFKFY